MVQTQDVSVQNIMVRLTSWLLVLRTTGPVTLQNIDEHTLKQNNFRIIAFAGPESGLPFVTSTPALTKELAANL